MKKGWLIGCGVVGGVVLVCGGIIGAVVWLVWLIFALTGPAVEAGDQFLTLLGEGRTTVAYNAAASGLRAKQTEEEFTTEMKKLQLTEYASSSWNNREIVNDQATLKGTVTTKTGGTVPLTIKLVKEDGTWKVHSINDPQAGGGVKGGP